MTIASMVHPRRKARMATLQCLFALDVREWSADVPWAWVVEEDPLPDDADRFAQDLANGVRDSLPCLDVVIHSYAPSWPVHLLAVVDRNILRIALFELLFHAGTSRKVAVNESVELAKIFGSESSARFVNGVLGSVIGDLESGALSLEQSAHEGGIQLPTVYERVKDIVVDKLGKDEEEVQETSSFVDDLGADSLDLVELIMAFEEEFSTDDNQVEISDDDAGNIATLQDAVNYLKDHGVTDD